jgi:hypothetical protein
MEGTTWKTKTYYYRQKRHGRKMTPKATIKTMGSFTEMEKKLTTVIGLQETCRTLSQEEVQL